MAVVPARRAQATISATLASLRLGSGDFVARVVVVTGEGDPTADVVGRWSERDGAVACVVAPSPLSAGAARNLGRHHAGDADLLLFIDADCRLEAGGARRLAAELDRDETLAAVSARVLRDGGAVAARLRHLLEFKEAASRRDPPPRWLPPSTVLLCKAVAFDDAGGFPDLWPGDDLVFAGRLLASPRRPRWTLAKTAAVTALHRHPPGLAEAFAHQRRLGFTAAVARGLVDLEGSALLSRRWLIPLLLPARIARLLRWQWREGRAALAETLLLLPLAVAALAVWTYGFLAGSAQAATDRANRRIRFS